jgi:hypothetical protein
MGLRQASAPLELAKPVKGAYLTPHRATLGTQHLHLIRFFVQYLPL